MIRHKSNGDCDLEKKIKRRASHGEEACPCRLRRSVGGGKAVVAVVKTTARKVGVVGSRVVVPESEDKICVMDECGNNNNKKGRVRDACNKRLGGSLDRRKNKKRFSVTSTSSSVSMLSSRDARDEDGDAEDENYCLNADLNNNNKSKGDRLRSGEGGGGRGGEYVYDFGAYQGGSEDGDDDENDEDEDKRAAMRQNQRNEQRDSCGSASSFTKDIMRMIGSNASSQRGDYYNGGHEGGEENGTFKDPLKDHRPSEVILKMNRRNSDMSERKFSHVICDCVCHEEAFEMRSKGGGGGKKRKSPTSPNSVNIYSIEEPRGKSNGKEWQVVGLEKGQLENRSDNEEDQSDCERKEKVNGEEYDNDELAYEDEVDRRRRSVL